MTRSFTTRLVVPMTLVAAVVIAAGLWVDYVLARDRIVQNLEQGARDSIAATIERIQELTTGLEGSVRFLSEAITEIPDEARINRVLHSVVDSNPHIFAAAIALDPALTADARGLAPYIYRQGSNLVRTDLAVAASPYWQEPWFTRIRDLGLASWVEPYFEPTGAKRVLTTFAAPLYRQGLYRKDNADNQQFIGIASIDVRLEDLYEYLDGLRVANSGFGFLVTGNGTFIGAPGGTVMSAPLKEVLQGDVVDDWVQGRQYPQRQPGIATVQCPGSQASCQLRLARIDGSPWSVGVVYSEDALLRPLRDYEIRALTLGTGMLLLLALMIGVVARRLTAPLLALAEASKSIARGELDVPLPT
ncbi:MAG: regulator, partial [Congregibacter sp.]|nr:regulator [Congregibacter sp.]